MNAILTNKNCKPYRINGVEDHVHILADVNPAISISELVKSLKLGSTECIKRDGLFKNFNGWQSGYGVFSCSIEDQDRLIEYIKNQEIHHQKTSFKDELIEILNENDVEFDEKYLL